MEKKNCLKGRTNGIFFYLFDTLLELWLPAVVKMWLSFERLCNLLTFHFFFFGNCFWLNQSAKSAMRGKKKSALHYSHRMVAVGLLAINSAGDVQPATRDVLGRTLGKVEGTAAAYGPTDTQMLHFKRKKSENMINEIKKKLLQKEKKILHDERRSWVALHRGELLLETSA